MTAVQILFSLVEFVACVGALIAKKIFDSLGEQVQKRNLKVSYEWSLTKTTTGSAGFSDLSLITFGAYAIITAIVLIKRVVNRNDSKEKCEIYLLAFGAALFAIEGSIIWLEIENIPNEIALNGYLLCGICYFISLLFFVDICIGDRGVSEKASQTDARCGQKVYRNTDL